MANLSKPKYIQYRLYVLKSIPAVVAIVPATHSSARTMITFPVGNLEPAVINDCIVQSSRSKQHQFSNKKHSTWHNSLILIIMRMIHFW